MSELKRPDIEDYRNSDSYEYDLEKYCNQLEDENEKLKTGVQLWLGRHIEKIPFEIRGELQDMAYGKEQL